PFLVMQYCSFGNIHHYLRTHLNASKIDLVHDVIAGMGYLHNKGIVHVDLKGVNILMDDKHNAVVADFGLSQAIDGICSNSAFSTRISESRRTLHWMAPECLDGEVPTKVSDVYSLGITIWEV
ncbi:hypothetical protein M422DRAFT_105803, partial [Sphaerobolus stellatus SS14]